MIFLIHKVIKCILQKESGYLKYMINSAVTRNMTLLKYIRLSLDEYADDIAKSADHCLF